MEAAFKKHKDVIFTEEIHRAIAIVIARAHQIDVLSVSERLVAVDFKSVSGDDGGASQSSSPDEIELPYENSLDWTKLSVKIAEVNAEKTIDILKRIPKSEIRNKQKAIESLEIRHGVKQSQKLDPVMISDGVRACTNSEGRNAP